jgi:multicomponent Na+:H+ antiporter subunit D
MVAVFLLSSLLSIGYLMPIVVRAFFRPLPEGEEDGIREASPMMVVPLCATALLCFLVFFYTDRVYRLLAPIVGLVG